MNDINKLAASLGLTVNEFYGNEGDDQPTLISAVNGDGIVVLYARTQSGIYEGLLSIHHNRKLCVNCSIDNDCVTFYGDLCEDCHEQNEYAKVLDADFCQSLDHDHSLDS